jgi:hypothetical protein
MIEFQTKLNNFEELEEIIKQLEEIQDKLRLLNEKERK